MLVVGDKFRGRQGVLSRVRYGRNTQGIVGEGKGDVEQM